MKPGGYSNAVAQLGVCLLFLILPEKAQARDLTFEDRVKAQEAIERIYYAHRTWPEGNPHPKPSFESVMANGTIRNRVSDYLRKSNALEKYWQRPITASQLDEELRRMVRDSRQPAVLAELFRALGEDPVLISECLVRPVLANRLVRGWYGRDDRFHAGLRRRAAEALRRSSDLEGLKTPGHYSETTWIARKESGSIETPSPNPAAESAEATVPLDPEEYEALLRRLDDLAEKEWQLSENDDSFFIVTVLERRHDRVRTATVSWMKTPFDAWWSTVRGELSDRVDVVADQPERVPATTSVPAPTGTCADDTWRSLRSGAPAKRAYHTAVWTGTEMIVWGGTGCDNGSCGVSSGARYTPATDTWTPTTYSPDTPTPRLGHTAVWTGTEMIVWGGRPNDVNAMLNSGGRYDPTTDTWTPTAMANVPEPRTRHTAVWSGTEMIVWGGNVVEGAAGTRYLNTGGRYNPSSNTWAATSTGAGNPVGRDRHTAVWTGSEMVVWGGLSPNFENTGGRYNPATDTWTPTGTGANVPTARYLHVSVWTGTRMIVWGGVAFPNPVNTGSLYNPATNSWTAMTTTGPPAARYGAAAVWTGSAMLVWGGNTHSSGLVNTGGKYDPGSNSWTVTGTGSGVPSPRAAHTAVWTGSEMIVWGGAVGFAVTDTGGRYDPGLGTWVPTSLVTDMPVGRYDHTSTWSGSEMIVWGGFNLSNGAENSGGRYVPALDAWTPTSTGASVPVGRGAHSAVWTGTELIVWGGFTGDNNRLNTGGRYNPTTDAWTATSTGANVPSARLDHVGIWTGTEMIVWGGTDTGLLNTGARYDPSTDAWTPMSASDVYGSTNNRAVWSGSEMLVWAGPNGGRYRPQSDTWQMLEPAGAPSPRSAFTVVWTGSEMIVWGGSGNDGYRYDPAAHQWHPTTTVGAPPPRYGHVAVWTGDRMIVWGGTTGTSQLTSGGRYDPVGDSWTPTAAGSHVPEWAPQMTSVWTDQELTVWGGLPGSKIGGRYCALTSCTATPPPGFGSLQVTPPSVGVARVQWSSMAAASGYDVVRGSLTGLHSSSGDFSVAVQTCLANDTSQTTFDDADMPMANEGFWYLVRAVNCAGAGTYDSGEPSQQGSRDTEIQASGLACP